MPNTYTAEDAIVQNQSDMLSADASMALTYTYTYDEAYYQLEQNMAAVLAYVDDMRASGDSIPPELLLQYQKLQIMQDQFLNTQGQVNQNAYDLLLQYQAMFGDLTVEGIEAMMNRLDAEDTWSDILEENEAFDAAREQRKAEAEARSEQLKAKREARKAAKEAAKEAAEVAASAPAAKYAFGKAKKTSFEEDSLAASFFHHSTTSEALEKQKSNKKKAAATDPDEDLSVTQHITFRKPNPRAIANIIGTLSDGSPIHPDHFGVPSSDWERIKQTLINGVITGENSDKIAQKIAGIHESMKQRAIGLARTEMFNAHRRASHETYAANDDVLDGWTWHAHLSPRTCAVCWAMHGKKFTTKQMMKAHVSCRCTQIPNVKGHHLDIISGEEAFAKLSDSDKLKVLGPTKLAMYKRGTIKLSDLVGTSVHPRFGEHPYEKSLKQLKAEGFEVPDLHTQNKITKATSHQMISDVPDVRKIQHSLNPNFQVAFVEEESKQFNKILTKANQSHGDRAASSKRIAQSLANNSDYLEAYNRYRFITGLQPVKYSDTLWRNLSLEDSNVRTTWNNTSGDSDASAILTQMAAKEQFHLNDSIFTYDPKISKDSYRKAFDSALQSRQYVLQAEYDETQRFFKEKNIQYVNVYRGMNFSYGGGPDWHNNWGDVNGPTKVIDVGLNPLSSFTTNPAKAAAFAGSNGYVLSSRVKVEQIHSMFSTGLGTDYEYEVVVLGAHADMMVTRGNVFVRANAPTDADGYPLQDSIHGVKKSMVPVAGPSYSTVPAYAPIGSISKSASVGSQQQVKWTGKVSKEFVDASIAENPTLKESVTGAILMAASGQSLTPEQKDAVKKSGVLNSTMKTKILNGIYSYGTNSVLILPVGWVGDPLTGGFSNSASTSTTSNTTVTSFDNMLSNNGNVIDKYSGKTVAVLNPKNFGTFPNQPTYIHADILKGTAHNAVLDGMTDQQTKTALDSMYNTISGTALKDMGDPLWSTYADSAQFYANKYQIAGLQESDFIPSAKATTKTPTINAADGKVIASKFEISPTFKDKNTPEYAHVDIISGAAHATLLNAATDPNDAKILNSAMDYSNAVQAVHSPADKTWGIYVQHAQKIADKYKIPGLQTQDFQNPQLTKIQAPAQPINTAPPVQTTTGGGTLPTKLDKSGLEPLFKSGGQYDKKLLNGAIKDYNENPTQGNYQNYLNVVSKVSTKLNIPAKPIGMTPSSNPITPPVQTTQDLQTAGPRATVGKSQVKLSEFTYDSPKPGGSADGAIYKDKNGDKWLIKAYPDAEQADIEVLAGKLYGLGGGNAPELMTIDTQDKWPGKAKVGVASKWITESIVPVGKATPAQKQKVSEDFALDAWLSNWDTIGMESENTVITKDGQVIHVDVGGSLTYKAMGGKKGSAFGFAVSEWDSLRDPNYPQNYSIFGKMTKDQLIESSKKVLKISDDEIRNAVMLYGPGTVGERKALADKLIARKQDIANRVQSLNGGVPVDVTTAPPKDWNAVLTAVPTNRIPGNKTAPVTVPTSKPPVVATPAPTPTYTPKPILTTPAPTPVPKPIQQPLVVAKTTASAPLVVPKGTKVAPPKQGDTVDDIALKKQMLDALLKQGDISKAWYYKSNKKLDEFVASGQALPSTVNKTGNLKSGGPSKSVAGILGAPGSATQSFSTPNPKNNSINVMVDGTAVIKNKDLQQATKAMDSAIKIGDFEANSTPPVLVKTDSSLQAGGQLETSNVGGVTKYTIKIDPNSSTPHLDYVHEMGHYIEDAFLNNAGDAQGNLPYDGLFSKIYYSPSYQAINKKAQAEDARSTYYEYLAGESETFARAFTQYVAIKSGDPALISQLQMGQKGTVPKFWSDDEFKPIMAEFDKMFIDLGWAIPT